MRATKFLLVPLAMLGLAGCETAGPKAYVNLGYGAPLEYSEAQCEIGAMGVEQGVFAMGSPGYVLGAQLGNAIGNEIRKAQFRKQCMILNGWKEVPAEQAAAYAASAARHRGPSATRRTRQAPLPPAYGNAAASGVALR